MKSEASEPDKVMISFSLDLVGMLSDLTEKDIGKKSLACRNVTNIS